MHKMKLSLCLLAVALLSFTTRSLQADSISASLDAGGTSVLLIETPILNGDQFTYTNTNVMLGGDPLQLNASNTDFLATYTDVLGVGLLNVTDVCAQVALNSASVPCENLAFSFTDLTLGNASVIADLGASVFASGNVADVNFAASIAGGDASVGFGQPPTLSPVPEPGTLSLMLTGLITAAGVFRIKLLA
jgi:hypothetical protein